MSIIDKLNNFLKGSGPGSYRFATDNPDNTDGVHQLDRLKPSDFESGKITKFQDSMTNRFLKTELQYDGPVSGDEWYRYEDPTILSFRIFFDFISEDSPLLLGFVGGDPAPGASGPLEGDAASDINKIKKLTHPNSALRYLLSIGDLTRAEYLISFQNLLKKMSQHSPWFFQSLEGLEEAWKHGFESDEFKAALSKDRKITINTLDEAIDFRITALIDLYRKACFDWINRREIVPRNLRRFSTKVYVHEARSINRYGDPGNPAKHTSRNDKENPYLYDKTKSNYEQSKRLLGANNFDRPTKSDYLDVQNENLDISRILFYFYYCEFLPDESVGTITGLSNKEMAIKSQKIAFSYGNVHEVNMFRLFHDKQVTDAFVGLLDKIQGLSAKDSKFQTANIALVQPVLAPDLTVWQYLKDKATDFAKDKLTQASNFLFGARPDKIGKAYPPTLLDVIIENLGLSDVADSPATQIAAKRALAELEKSKFVNELQNMFAGNVYGFSPAKLLGQATSGINGILDALNVEGLESNASLKNDDGPDSSRIGPEISKTYANENELITNKSLLLANNSKNNDSGTDAKDTTPANSQSSLSNDKGPDSKETLPVNSQGSLVNDKGPGSKDTAPVNPIASLSNDKGPDSKDTAPVDPQSSLSNDKGMDAKSPGSIPKEFLYGGGNSLKNDKGPDSKDTSPVNPQTSLVNDKGMDAKSVGQVPKEFLYGGGISLTNDNGKDSKDIEPGNSQSSLTNI